MLKSAHLEENNAPNYSKNRKLPPIFDNVIIKMVNVVVLIYAKNERKGDMHVIYHQ